jgi:hypothetical protein
MCDSRWEVRSTARQLRVLVSGAEAAVVLGVLGYPLAGTGGNVSAGELVARARRWQSRHDPDPTCDPVDGGELDWTPVTAAVEAYHRCPPNYRRAFSAFCLSSRPLVAADRITWRGR